MRRTRINRALDVEVGEMAQVSFHFPSPECISPGSSFGPLSRASGLPQEEALPNQGPNNPYSVVQSRPFDLLVLPFWSIFSHGPKRLTF